PYKKKIKTGLPERENEGEHIRASCSLKWITYWKRMQDSRDSNKRHASSFIYINTHIL
ncbi:hypothetical protein HN51_043266, partial [Arachis hypogaea]